MLDGEAREALVSSARDLHAALGRAVEMLEREKAALEDEVARLARENSEQCDDIEALRVTARKAGLDAGARQALEMVVRYLDEGDAIDSIRVLACLRRAADAVKALQTTEAA